MKTIQSLLEQYVDELNDLHRTRENIEGWLEDRHTPEEKTLGNIRLIKVEILIEMTKKHVNLLEILLAMNRGKP